MATVGSAAARMLSTRSLQVSQCTTPNARTFLRLLPSTTPHSPPDFLIPRFRATVPRCIPRSRRSQAVQFSTSRTQYHGTVASSDKASTATSVPPAASSVQSGEPVTRVVQNPQEDDDGNEMTIEITQRASKRLKEIMVKDQNPNLALRIMVESGGCHGFQYLMSLTTLPTSDGSAPVAVQEGKAEEESAEEETIFDADGAKVVMDLPSLQLLKGSKVDFTQELIGSQFKIVDNPLATSSCGCGTSFDIKF